MFNATMKFDLGEDVNALRDAVHRFAQDRIKPLAAEVDRSNVFPAALWREMGDMGLLGITVSEEFGGAGMSYLAHVIAVEEIARASASARPSRTRALAASATASAASRAATWRPSSARTSANSASRSAACCSSTSRRHSSRASRGPGGSRGCCWPTLASCCC